MMCLSMLVLAQVQNPPFIDVIGTADMQVIPDEIFIAITIRERNSGTNRTVKEQEAALKSALKDIGSNLDDLEFSDADADYVAIHWWNKKTFSQRRYRFKAQDAYMVGKVFEQLDKLIIQDAYISEVSHSNIISFKKEVRIKAIKAAKEKADYLLNAIGQTTGPALQVYENQGGHYDYKTNRSIRQHATALLEQFSDESHKLQFQKIKLQASVFVKFGIE